MFKHGRTSLLEKTTGHEVIDQVTAHYKNLKKSHRNWEAFYLDDAKPGTYALTPFFFLFFVRRFLSRPSGKQDQQQPPSAPRSIPVNTIGKCSDSFAKNRYLRACVLTLGKTDEIVCSR